MKNTENLLSVVRLKKYFPVKTAALFSRKKQYLRANENVSFTVRKGETFAIVGESGCGKSTLGKTILQLYRPTDGGAYYYGKTLDEITPRYAFAFLARAEKLRERYLADPDAAIEGRDIQAHTAVKFFGGLLAAEKGDFDDGVRWLKVRFDALKRLQKRPEDAEAKERLAAAEKQLSDIRERVKTTPAGRALERRREDAVELSMLTPKEMRALRRDMQIVFQDPYSSLDPRMTVGQIVEEGVATHGFYKKGSPAMREYVLRIMQACGLQPHTYDRYPHQFSGGQRQRVCIARALAVKPRFIVCDECVSALDCSIQSQILNLLSDLKEKEGLTYLFISHDLSVVRHVSDRVAVMYLGEIMETGETEDVFQTPRHPYTISLISAAPTAYLHADTEEKILPKGNLPSAITPPKGCKYHTRCFMAQEKCRLQAPPFVEVEKGHFVACHFASIPAEKKREIARKS